MKKNQCARSWNPSSVPMPPEDTHLYKLGIFAHALFVVKTERREAKILERPLRLQSWGRLIASASTPQGA